MEDLENHNLVHLVTIAIAMEVFCPEGMHEMLSKEKCYWKVSDKREGVVVCLGAGRTVLMFLKM